MPPRPGEPTPRGGPAAGPARPPSLCRSRVAGPSLAWPSADERFLRAYDAELVALRVGQHGPGLRAGLPDVDPARPQREEALDLLVAVFGGGGEVEVHAVLDELFVGDGHEAHADRGVLVGPDDDLALSRGEHLPAQGPRPEPGQPGQVVTVDDDVVQGDRHAASLP